MSFDWKLNRYLNKDLSSSTEVHVIWKLKENIQNQLIIQKWLYPFASRSKMT
jgi:hypothetical protein